MVTSADIRGVYIHELARSYEGNGKTLRHRLAIYPDNNSSIFYYVSRDTNKGLEEKIIFQSDNLAEALLVYNKY